MITSYSNSTHSNIPFLTDLPSIPSGTIERILGKDRNDWTMNDLVQFVLNEKIRLIALMHIGGDGWIKTLDFAPRNQEHLIDIFSAGERADGSSIFSGLGIQTGKSDIVLRPRIDSAFIDPFSPVPTLVFLCDHYGRDGKPLPESPTTILERAEKRLFEETGISLYALAELEYYLGAYPEECDFYGSNDRGYHSTSPFVYGESLRRQALVILSEMGIPTKYGHSEVGYINADETDPRVWEQHEIELSLQPIGKSAENAIIAQWVLRNLAHRNGMRCSFSPVLKRGHAGSGMHFHLSAVVQGKHQPVFESTGDLTELSKWIIGGLVQMGGVLMAFGNREESSFVRLNQAKEAPNQVTWGQFNRKALVRIPIIAKTSDGKAVSEETIEYRLPDGSAHPQFLLAGIAQSICYAKTVENLDYWLQVTSTESSKNQSEKISIPKSQMEIANQLMQFREIFERGNVFPSQVIDGIRTTLGIES